MSGGDIVDATNNSNLYPAGVCVIINQRDFDASTEWYGKPREGSDEDAKELEKFFKRLDFQVIIHKNRTQKQIKDIFKGIEEGKYQNKQRFVCAILSHGEDGEIWGTDKKVAIKDLAENIDQAPDFKRKQKFFILQACRGNKGTEAENHDPSADAEEEVTQVELPLHFEFLYAYATSPDTVAYRDIDEKEKQGSRFVKALLEVFEKEYERMDVMKMLTRVIHKIVHDKKVKIVNDKEVEVRKVQLPCITSYLTEPLFLKSQKSTDQRK